MANLSVLHDVYDFQADLPEHSITLKDKIPNDKEKCILLQSHIYSVDSSYPVSSADRPPPETKDFYDSKHTAIAEPSFEDNSELDPNIAEPKGHSLNDAYQKLPEDIVDLSKYDEVQRPYIEKIFLKKYPKILAKGSLDSGNLSKTLGSYKLRLKDNQTLPRHKKVFFLNPSDSQHLKDILSFLLKNNIIIRAPMSGDQGDLHGSPAYLIPRSNRNSAARLVVDY